MSSDIMGSSCQSITALKFGKSRYQRRKIIRTIAVKIFIEVANGSYVMAVGN